MSISYDLAIVKLSKISYPISRCDQTELSYRHLSNKVHKLLVYLLSVIKNVLKFKENVEYESEKMPYILKSLENDLLVFVKYL